MATIEELLAPKTAPELKAILLGKLQREGYPTTDWNSGSIDRTLLEIFSETIADQVEAYVPDITAGGFNELASDEGGLESWLTLLAYQLYNNTRYVATPTEGYVLLTNTTASPIVIALGDVRVIFPTANIYENIEADTLPASGTLSLLFRSEAPNDSAAGINYTDQSNTLSQLLTSLPGVSVTNPAPDFSAVTLSGNGTGTLEPVNTGTPTPSSIVVRITSSGDIGVATFDYQIDGGSWVEAGFVTTLYTLPGMDIDLDFANGAGTPNSFLEDDQYHFVAPGSWMTQQGTDLETATALRERNRTRWPTLSETPTEDAYTAFCRAASSAVVGTRVAPSEDIPGGVDITISGQAGAVPSSVVTACQEFIDQRMPLNDRALVQSAAALAITLTGTVFVRLANKDQAQADAQRNVVSSIASAGIGGTYYLSQFIEDVMSATGVRNASGLTINGFAADLVFTSNQVGIFSGNVITSLVWVSF